MQSVPSEVPPTATSVDSALGQSTSSSQHGPHIVAEQSFDRFSPADIDGRGSASSDYEDHALHASIGADRGRRLNTRCESRNTTSSGESSPGSRIDAYEKANASPRKLSDGMIFQVVPNASGKLSTVSILDLPNEVLTHVLSHLPPETLSMMSLICHRFHKLVTTPPAWRIAFTRFFPGSESVPSAGSLAHLSNNDNTGNERRSFTRLSALASWRSEYILRTRLLRSLARGRPAIRSSSKGSGRQGNIQTSAVTPYSSGLLYPVSHVHATFGIGLNKKQPLFIHGASEQGAVSTSDPSVGKVGGWGLGDFEAFKHFADLYIGEAEYGLGPGNLVGMPNVMDLSQPYGRVYGEACPGGRLFFTSTMEQRGRFLPTTSLPNHDCGIPMVTMLECSVTAVWIAKSDNVLKATNGVFGCLAGFSNGVLAAYALGVNPVQDRRFSHGEPTAKWVFSPGVPIIAIVIDENVNANRIGHRRIWATALNALGEIFYLVDVPVRPDHKGKLSEPQMDQLAWQTGRTVSWQLIEGTRRMAKADPYSVSVVDGSYSPGSSSDAQGLSKEQLIAETKEIEKYIGYKPKHFRELCDGWDMRRKLIVDFAGDDHNRGGESVFVIGCGFEKSVPASIRRITRILTKVPSNFSLEAYPPITAPFKRSSIFSSSPFSVTDLGSPSPQSLPRSRTSSHDSFQDTPLLTEWRISCFNFGYLKGVQITTVATDNSDFATLAVNEDPLLGMSGGSNTSSPLASPIGRTLVHSSPSEIPGRRARLMAVGTSNGAVILWNMRSTVSPAPDVINSIQPQRYIYTRSPQISSLALTALYIVHGGNDGLVQAWDPLASTNDPVRTLNSRFSDRARRRIAQAEASAQGVGNNYYAAGAIVLDSDPTVLRGLVSLGTHLRYWSYSALAADAYKSRKRGQLRRRSERGSNSATNEQKFHHTGRSVLKDYIQNEKQELENEKIAKRKEKERLTGRFGTTLLGEDASEEEMLAYATMLSQESFAKDAERLKIASQDASSQVSSRNDPEPMNVDIEEAIRLSLLDSEIAAESPQTNEYDIPIRFGKAGKRQGFSHQSESESKPSMLRSGNEEDLEFALQLSLAEQESRAINESDFPALSPGSASDRGGKGKGKGKSSYQ